MQVSRLHFPIIIKEFELNETPSGYPVKCAETCHHHKQVVEVVTLLPDGRVLSGSGDTTLKVKNFQAQTPEQTVNRGTDRWSLPVYSAKVLCSNWIVAVGCIHGDIQLFQTDLKNDCGSLNVGVDTIVKSVSGITDEYNHYRVVASYGGKISAWDLSLQNAPNYKYDIPYQGPAHNQEINAMLAFNGTDFTENSDKIFTLLASASNDGTVKIWNPTHVYKSHLIQTLPHEGAVRALTLVPQEATNPLLISASDDGTLNIWNPCDASNYLISQIDMKRELSDLYSPTYSLVHLSKGVIASGHEDGRIHLWNTLNREDPYMYQLHESDKHTGIVCTLEVLKDGSLVSGSYDKTIKWWVA